MTEDTQILVQFARHNPFLLLGWVLGFSLIGMAGVLHFYMLRKLVASGYKVQILNGLIWRLPAAYRKGRNEGQNWPSWPEYLVWPCVIAGIVLLIATLSQP